MAFLIGTDEAGYGPNLGPLTICGTLWSVDQDLDGNTNLYELLTDCVSAKREPEKLLIADSKNVYQSAGSIESLETNVLAILLAVTGTMPSNWNQLSDLLNVADGGECPVWMDGNQLRLPICADRTTVEMLANLFSDTCHRRKVQLVDCVCQAVSPKEFNVLVDRLGNKAEVLSSQTLQVVGYLRDKTDGDLLIGCDKHGGRSKYAGMINQYLTPEFIRIHQEAIKLSRYSWAENGRQVQVNFRAKGESFLPTALASMIAKYVREVVMTIWNRYWKLKKPGIRPTQGYPVDAKRFKREIESVQFELGIQDETIWRKR